MTPNKFPAFSALTLSCALLGSASALQASYSAAVLADNPISYFQFEGNLNDSGSGANNATGTTGFTYDSVNTFTGTGQSLNDTATSDIALSTAASNLYSDLSGVSAITIEAWVDFTAFTGGSIFRITTGTGQNYLNMRVITTGGPTNAFELSGRSIGGDLNQSLTFSSNAQNSGKTHIVGVMDIAGDSMTLYVDGVQAITGAKTFSSTTFNTTAAIQSILIGNGSANFVGTFDELAIYGTALNATQVLTHYNAAVAIPEPSTFAALAGLGALGLVSLRRRGVRRA